MGSKSSGDRARGGKRKRRPGAGRPPQFTKAVDRAVEAVNKLLVLAEQRGISTNELQRAQTALDSFVNEIKQKTAS